MVSGLLILTAFLAFASKELLGTSQPIKWSPVAYGHLFIIGVAAFHLRDRHKSAPAGSANIWIGAAVALFIPALSVDFSGRSEVLAVSTAVLIVFVTPARASWVTAPLTTRPMLFLGSISYSIYLIHILVIHILGDVGLLPTSGSGTFVLVYGITVALSTVTYLVIEKPANRAGRWLVQSAS